MATVASRGKITRTFGEVTISSEFDSGNIERVELVDGDLGKDLEFSLWTSSDCAGTPFENGNRSWFYFKVITPVSFNGKTIRFNIMNLNKQTRLYNQGLTPIFKSFPGRGHWERLRGIVQCEMENGEMKLVFDYAVHDSHKRTSYFAFCFPFSYTECQNMLEKLDSRLGRPIPDVKVDPNEIYYHRELLCRSLEGRRVDLVTVSSHHGLTSDEEPRLPGLFPDSDTPRARKFKGKKVFLLSSRVHPGETPSSFVFNGFLNFILRADDPRSIALRRNFVFKLIPMLNPDGVARGHYRMDSRGVNLNRYYLSPDPELHPSIFAARSVFLHHHTRRSVDNTISSNTTNGSNITTGTNFTSSNNTTTSSKPTPSCNTTTDVATTSPEQLGDHRGDTNRCGSSDSSEQDCVNCKEETVNSGVAFYVDLHGHASKRGCFIYGNHFSSEADQAETMLFPKLISLNSAHFDFGACLFSEKNMYTTDKNGTSKEGSGRVALHKASGHLHCYTLECNYNSGRMVNSITSATTDGGRASPPQEGSFIPHKYSIEDYEEVGRGVAIAVLDMCQLNPWSRIPKTEYGSLANIRHSLLHQVSSNRAKGKGKVSSAPSKQVVGTTSDREDVSVFSSKPKLVVDCGGGKPTRRVVPPSKTSTSSSRQSSAVHGEGYMPQPTHSDPHDISSGVSGCSFTRSQLLGKKEFRKLSAKCSQSRVSSLLVAHQQKLRPLGKVPLKPSLASMSGIHRTAQSSKEKPSRKNEGKSVSPLKKSRIPKRVEYMKMKLRLSSSATAEHLEKKLATQHPPLHSTLLADGNAEETHRRGNQSHTNLDGISTSVSSSHFRSQMELKNEISPPNLPERKLLRRQKQSVNHQIANCFLLMDWKKTANSSAEKLVPFDTIVKVGPDLHRRHKLNNSF